MARKAKYEPLTLSDVFVLKRALAIAHESMKVKAEAEPDQLAKRSYARECGDSFRLYKRLTDQPDIATRPL